MKACVRRNLLGLKTFPHPGIKCRTARLTGLGLAH